MAIRNKKVNNLKLYVFANVVIVWVVCVYVGGGGERGIYLHFHLMEKLKIYRN